MDLLNENGVSVTLKQTNASDGVQPTVYLEDTEGLTYSERIYASVRAVFASRKNRKTDTIRLIMPFSVPAFQNGVRTTIIDQCYVDIKVTKPVSMTNSQRTALLNNLNATAVALLSH